MEENYNKEVMNLIEQPVKGKSGLDIINEENRNIDLEIEQIRDRYKKLFSANIESSFVQAKEQSQEEKEKIDYFITIIEQKAQQINEKTLKSDRRKIALSLLEYHKKLKEYSLTIEQAEKINCLLEAKQLNNLSIAYGDKIDYFIKYARNSNIKQLSYAIENKIYQTDSIEELEILHKKLTPDMESKCQIVVSSVKSKIRNKIIDMQKKVAIEKLKQDLPQQIEQIIVQLCAGENIDIKKLNDSINTEVKERLNNRPKSVFRVNEEQERRQILMQIRNAIEEKIDKYQIKDGQQVINILQDVCQIDEMTAIKTVVGNLTSRREYQEATNICDMYNKNTVELTNKKYIKSLKQNVKNAEISDIMLGIINAEGTEEENRMYFKMIKKGLTQGNIKLKQISLGKTQDDKRHITLADVWIDDNEKEVKSK